MLSLKRILQISLGFILCGLLATLILYFVLRSDLPSVSSLKDVKWQTPMQIYSADGKLMNQFGEKKRVPLKLEQFPQQLIDAILATEDDRFYLHFGVDPVGMTRAILGQIMGQNKGGASTITMQVARNFFLSPEVTYIRKIREIFTAFHIEYLLSKDEILSLYLNKIPLGHRTFGFGAAAQVYYGKDIQELNLAQIAVLAGLPKAPSSINPITSPSRAKARRAVVLHRMLVSGYINEKQHSEANAAPITAKKHGAEIELSAPYVAEMAHQKMVQMYGAEQAYTGGYKVFTTVTSSLQLAAESAVLKNLYAYDQRHGYRGPITNLRPESLNRGSTISTEASNDDIDPITFDEIRAVMAQRETYQDLQLAVIMQVNERSATAVLGSGETITIEWQGMSWARQYVNDDKQGPAPKLASDIVHYGDLVYVTKNNDNYQLNQLPQASGAMVALSPDNGSIQAVVGGFSFEQSQFNRVTQAKRQVGSNIKPFVYSAALENGFTLASLVNDAPINQWDKGTGIAWRPKNSPERYDGLIRVRIALAQSKNVVAVRLFREVGIERVIAHLSSFGFAPDDLPRDESLALGSAALTPLEIATGMATFANGGFLVEPFVIDRIEDSFGNIVYQTNPTLACDDCDHLQDYTLTADTSEQVLTDNVAQQRDLIHAKKAPRVISAQNAFLITEGLNEAIWGADWSKAPGWQGTGWRARVLKRRDIAGKTGTTNEAKDAWFTGYSRHLVATSWIGFDDPSRNLGRTVRNSNLPSNQITGKEFGARSAQPAWVDFMQVALQGVPAEPFQQPADLLSVRIDKYSGKLTTKTDKSSLFEFFELGTAPTTYDTHDNSSVILDGNQAQEEVDIF